MSIPELLNQRKGSTEEALQVFDSLEPIEVDFMIGNWKGEGFHTNHPMDGLLEAYHWHGKKFDGVEDVHPLVFSKVRGGFVNVNPIFMGPLLGLMHRVSIPKFAAVGRLFQVVMPLFATTKSRARLRLTGYRGKSSATMIYDHLPINDIFRRIDEDTVFGIMDLKGMERPFFFILHREGGS